MKINLPRPTIGILLMLAGVMMLPIGDSATKLLSSRYPLAQLLWMKCFPFFWCIWLITNWRHGLNVFITGKTTTILLVSRALFWLAASFCYFIAIKYMPLSNASAIALSSPLILVVLLFLLQRDPIPQIHFLAVVVGLVAMLLVIRPGFDGFNSASIGALGAGFLGACYLFANRLLRNAVSPLVQMSYQLGVGTLVLTPLMPFVWVRPTSADLMFLIAASLLYLLGHLLITSAFNFAQASLLAPFIYSTIITNTVIGYFLFGDLPDILTSIGILLLVGVGIYVSMKDPTLRPRTLSITTKP